MQLGIFWILLDQRFSLLNRLGTLFSAGQQVDKGFSIRSITRRQLDDFLKRLDRFVDLTQFEFQTCNRFTDGNPVALGLQQFFVVVIQSDQIVFATEQLFDLAKDFALQPCIGTDLFQRLAVDF